MVAAADAKKQDALRELRQAELRATQITQATADAERLKVNAEAEAEAEAIRLRKVASAQAQAIREVNQAIAEGGDAYLALRQLEMLPQIAPVIANALAQAKLVNIASDGKGAANGAADQITGVIQTVLAAQLVTHSLGGNNQPAAAPVTPTPTVTPAVSTPAVRLTGSTIPPRVEKK